MATPTPVTPVSQKMSTAQHDRASRTTTERGAATDVDPCLGIDPSDVARSAGLRYVSDARPGIRRKRSGKHFRYFDIKEQPIRDSDELARIKSLAIPPAWTDVWICPSAKGHIQATGRDAKGRKQYRYHPRWREVRDETKYGRLQAFGEALPALRKQVDADLARTGLVREKVVATVVRLLELTLIRVGNDEYARTNESYGLTTMQDDHVTVTGTTIAFSFRGKSGKEHTIDLRDRRLANIVKRCRDLPGHDLFQFVDDNGVSHTIGSVDVNDYLQQATGQTFTAKDFRTWSGTLLAAHALLNAGPADTQTATRHSIVSAVKDVSTQLGNTPAICRRCYVHPGVIDAFESGSLFGVTTTDASTHWPDLSPDEQFLLCLLSEC